MLSDSIISFDQHSHTHTLSLCLSATLLSFPIFPFSLKAHSTNVLISIEIQISPYSVVLISKETLIQKLMFAGKAKSLLGRETYCITLKRKVEVVVGTDE